MRKKILFLANAHYVDPKRGTPLHMCYFFRELRKEHDLHICVASAPKEFDDIFIPYPSQRGLRKLRPLISIVREYKPDYVCTANEGGLLPPIALKLFCGVKIAVEIQGLGAEELYADGSIGYIHSIARQWKVRWLLRWYDLVFAVSQKLADFYAPISRQWVIVRGGAAVEEIPDASKLLRDASVFTIGYMGNARAYQGLPNLLEAAAILKKRGVPVRLNLILSGQIASTQSLLDSLGLRDITMLHNNVPHDQVNTLIASSDALVIPRPSIPITEYAFPGKLAECLATGIPTVMTEVGPVHELRDELEKCAVIVGTEHMPQQLASAFERIFKMGLAERQALGFRAREYARRALSWEVLAPVYANAFRRE